MGHSAMASTPAPPILPVRRLTRLLADLQTTIVGGGLRCFGGDVERFAIFSLIVSASLSGTDRGGAISVHSAALSLNRPFETVRRHAYALVDGGYCVRSKAGLTVATAAWTRPDIAALLGLTHDAFVRFVDDCALFRALDLPPAAAGRQFTAIDGVQAAVALMLGTADSNRAVHRDAVDLVLFSTILHANALRYEEDGSICMRVEAAPAAFGPTHAVRLSAIARTLNMPETTVRRRLADITGPDRAVLRTPQGLVVSAGWMNTPQAVEVSEQSYSAIRRILARATSAGFPFDAPASAYLAGRPPTARVI